MTSRSSQPDRQLFSPGSARPPRGSRERPLFIVGCPRSGTTLVGVILDGHPRLAVPPETAFVLRLAPEAGDEPDLDGKRGSILGDERFPHWGLDPEIVRSHVGLRTPQNYPELVDEVFQAYAQAHHKQRWGDKAPGYVRFLPRLRQLFPDAQVLHVIRDGRDVAASLAERGWGPGEASVAAFWWRDMVRAGRRAGQSFSERDYLEVRLEDLLYDPEEQVRKICTFLGEEFVASMLDYPAREGSVKVPWSDATKHLAEPPRAGLRDWRAGLSPLQQRAVESICGPLLDELGYEVPSPSHVAAGYAWFRRLLYWGRQVARRDQLRRRIRERRLKVR